MPVPTSTEVSIDKLGKPGVVSELIVVPALVDECLSDHERLTDTAKRKFELKALLGKHSIREGNISLVLDADEGDSFIVAPDGSSSSMLHSPLGMMVLHHNAKRELSLITFDCEATSLFEARTIFIRALTPFVDHICFLANIPIHIARVSCFDSTHQIQSVEYVGPHASVKLNPHEGAMEPELFPIYALYREAKNSSSSLYKFLCYFKIIEGVCNSLRSALFKRAEATSISITKRKELVPALAELLPDQEVLIGTPVRKVFDNRFRKLRDQAAHFLLRDARPINVSDSEIYSRFSNELPLIEACARVVVDTQHEYLRQLLNGTATDGKRRGA